MHNMEFDRDYVFSWLQAYLSPDGQELIEALALPHSNEPLSNQIKQIVLPEWAAECGVGSPASISVPAHCLVAGECPEWKRVDWIRACFDMLTCQAEWLHEKEHGPVHSYSYKLPKALHRQFDHAWVNRIALFLRAWVARQHGQEEIELFGARPKGRVHLTHDVDYVSKTLALRIKQSVFILFNALRSLKGRDMAAFAAYTKRLIRFAFSLANYWQFPVITRLEQEAGVTSQWNFYGGKGGWLRPFSQILLDPSYQYSSRLQQQLQTLIAAGNTVGLHQAFHSWDDADQMALERDRVEQAAGNSVKSCRQHWLRFSLTETWQAQEEAGFTLDTTLGFNDRIAFRNAAALKMPAWLHEKQRPSSSLNILPMVLMDSHLFDYGRMDEQTRRAEINKVLDEIEHTGGEVTVIWHQRVFHPDYNWGDDYAYLLNQMVQRNLL